MDTMQTFVYLINNLDDMCRVKSVAPSGVKATISQIYRFMLKEYIRLNDINEFISLVLRSICGDVVTKDEFLTFVCESLLPERFFKLHHKELKALYEFLIDNIQISKEDAKLMIELRLMKINFFGDYIEITTALNEEVLEHGFE